MVSAYDVIRHLALGADWCNMARPFMFSLAVFRLLPVRPVIVQQAVATMNRVNVRS